MRPSLGGVDPDLGGADRPQFGMEMVEAMLFRATPLPVRCSAQRSGS